MKPSKSRFKAKVEEAPSIEISSSSYLQQKNAYEQLAGSKNEDSGKWLVR